MRMRTLLISLLAVFGFAPLVLAVPGPSLETPPTFDLEWGAIGSGDGEFSFPAGITQAGDGNVYVSDNGNGRVQIFTADGNFDSEFPTGGAPQGLEADGGNLFVAIPLNDVVELYDLTGALIATLGGTGSGVGEFDTPRDVAVNHSNGLVYVADSFNGRVSVWEFQSLLGVYANIGFVGSPGGGPGQLTSPQHVAVADNGNIYVADAFADKIVVYTPAGGLVTEFGGTGGGPGSFATPRGLDVNGAGRVYVADDGANSRVQIFALQGSYKAEIGGTPFGSDPGDFNFPEDVHTNDSGECYVVDSGNSRIQKFYPGPTILSVLDVENDQGRFVRINLEASSQDRAEDRFFNVEAYDVYRRIDALPSSTVLAADANRGSLLGPDIFGYDIVTRIPASGEGIYNVVVPTLADTSDAEGVIETCFFVRAVTDNRFFFVDSKEGCGYSVDNMAPAAPANFAANFLSPAVELTWDPAMETDIREYMIYRDIAASFEPNEGNLLAVIPGGEVSYIDPEGGNQLTQVFYQIRAVDKVGNNGDTSEATPFTTDSGSNLPVSFALYGSTPNPLRAQTTLRFDLPRDAAVSLTIYDSRGRTVRTAYSGSTIGAGRHQWSWDRRSDAGVRVPAGIYFANFSAGGFAQTSKMVVVE